VRLATDEAMKERFLPASGFSTTTSGIKIAGTFRKIPSVVFSSTYRNAAINYSRHF
jgi:hypothetical protein